MSEPGDSSPVSDDSADTAAPAATRATTRPRRWWRRQDARQDRTPRQGDWTAQVGAIAASLGLIVTAVVSYYGILVTQEQLKQSKEESEKEVRAQAALVTTWVDPGDTTTVNVANRSLDPVAVARLDLRPIGIRKNLPPGIALIIQFTSMAPCTRYTIKISELKKVPKLRKRLVDIDTVGIASFIFRDSDRRMWTRDYRMRLDRFRAGDEKVGTPKYVDSVGLWEIAGHEEASLKNCGSKS